MNVLGMDKKQMGIFSIMAAIILALSGFIFFRELQNSSNSGLVLADDYSFGNHKNEKVMIHDSNENRDAGQEHKPGKIKVYITGQVANPGVVEVEEGSRLGDVIKKAGGVLEDADLLKVNLALKVKDEGMYVIPKEGEPVAEDVYSISGSPKEQKKININTAGESELQQLPRIGPVLARKIIEYREANGYFKSIEDIKNVSGIGDKIFEGLKDLISVE